MQVNPTWRGVVVPTPEEASFLLDELLLDQGTSVDHVAEESILHRPAIEEIIRLCVRLSIYEYDDLDVNPEEDHQLTGGLESGFRFMLGCITYTKMLRSDVQRPGHLPAEYDLPLHSKVEIERVKAVRRGQAVLDTVHYGDDTSVISSSDFAMENAGELLIEYPYLTYLLEDYCTAWGNSYGATEELFNNGFYSGVAEGLELHLQCAEERAAWEIPLHTE